MNENILNYLHAELTQKEVAERISVSEVDISRILQNCKNADMKDFNPFLYNLWNSNKNKSNSKRDPWFLGMLKINKGKSKWKIKKFAHQKLKVKK